MSDDTGKRPLGFVNRRGHSSHDVSAAELDSLSIDEQSPEAPAGDASVQPTQKKGREKTVKSKRRHRIRWSRRKTVVLLVILFVLVAIPVGIGEVLRVQYLASASSSKSSLETIIHQDVLPLQKKSDITAMQVAGVTDKLEKVRDGMCPGGMIDNMAALYPRAHQAHTACIDQRTQIASLATQLRGMQQMLAYIEGLNASLAGVTAPSTDTYAIIANQLSSWQQANDKIRQLAPPTDFRTAHEQLAAAVQSIADGWSKLNIANNEQNMVNFSAAEEQLTKGYEAVRASRDVFTASLSTKQTSINGLARQL